MPYPLMRPVRCCATISANRAPANIGDHLADVDTPALLVDLDVVERNCEKLRRTMAAYPGVAIRPHAKAHKCADLAQLQLRLLAARGVCCQKVVEAEAMAEGGITDLLLTNEVVAARKVDRLVGLAAAGARVGVCFEDPDNLRHLNRAAAARGTTLDVLLELNVGQDRQVVVDAVWTPPSRRWTWPGQPPPWTTSASGGCRPTTGPFNTSGTQGIGRVAWRRLEAASGVFTEVQPGSFVFNDADYSRNVQVGSSGGVLEEEALGGGGWQRRGVGAEPLGADAGCMLVMSTNPSRGLAVVDAGTKAVSLDSGPPQLPRSFTEMYGVTLEYVSGGDEHGKLLWPQGAYQLPPQLPPVGAMLKLQPGHCDPTVNLYDWIVAVRSENRLGGNAAAVAGGGDDRDDDGVMTVVAVWPVRGRGPGQ
ncbi:hypothetical protein VOLCADRAFT_90489 [Volvox carteri f. nagariensis]|uniref:D-serine dehydratase-like domain-containing protein n=1 Tax=Volvox carteri f. nagariensis TaxID=3068 RepID=D8TUI6_VOLCA|nr:uncharacterized protein VOLCADRAFT_90489 [Volvox carteri f. nagariensis]EFJ48715.1 hypothetical protein VOLCADRAFT_90489 [Volvox carteri f. nagariensis]|eukprot:XP_002950047.1 hypothetical protein VOLCADRAFT_90489 [Volvox carteri f. nagariensis]